MDSKRESFLMSTHQGSSISTGIYFAAAVYVACCFIACFILEPNLRLTLCDQTSTDGDIEFENPAYTQSSCHNKRFPILLYLSIQECSFGRRMISALVFGALIGWERRQEDRPAGIRTMALVSLGSCLFCICSTFAFLSGPMTWDSARVSAAIPSGVGFLGAGLIFKNAEKNELGDMEHTVHGITTAISLWISAAVGIACGGELYFVASYSVGVMMLMLRFGPRATDVEVIDSVIDASTMPSNFAPITLHDPEMQSLNSLSFEDIPQLPKKFPRSRVNSTATGMRSFKSTRPQLME